LNLRVFYRNGGKWQFATYLENTTMRFQCKEEE